MDPAEREAKMHIKKQFMSPDVQNYRKLFGLYENDCNFAIHTALKDAKDVLDQYKTARNEMCQDADGIYLIVSGAAKLVNKVDPISAPPLVELEPNQCFGDSKFLIEPSYSYFGDLIATVPSVNKEQDGDKQLEIVL